MSTIQVRNVPDDLHRRLKSRAARQGKSLSDYLLEELKVAADRPTMTEWLAAVDELPAPPKRPPTPASEVLADERRR